MLPGNAKLSRRSLLSIGGASFAWLTPLAEMLARAAEQAPGRSKNEPVQSVIVLWMAGGPSQLETFDPHAGTKIAGGTKSIETSVPGVQLAEGLERTAEQLRHCALVRSLVSKEGDHERGMYLLKTGYRPDPTTVHPSIGAIVCHELPRGGTEIPRHISILPAGPSRTRGGFLGDQYDPFQTGDPLQPLPDLGSRVPDVRYERRLADLDVLENSFARGRKPLAEATLHRSTVQAARTMMTSDQLQAFNVNEEPKEVLAAYGDTPFGRGCLAARRLIGVGVRCVEVTLGGWDTHANNREGTMEQKQILDPALAALLADLRRHELWQKTIVLCAGEFGRTPAINRLEGRDHWPSGFSALLAGGAIRGGQVIGGTDPAGSKNVQDPRSVADLHATILTAVGLDPAKENISPIGRPIKLAEGAPLRELLR